MTSELTFDDVLIELAFEGAEPRYENLLRWQARYPKFRVALEEYFAVWAIQSEELDDPPEMDTEAIVQEGVEFAMKLAREQGRLVENDRVEQVSDFDQMMLSAIYLLHGRGDAVAIRQKVSEMSEKRVSLGPVLMALTRLEERFWIEPSESDPVSEADGSSRQYFTITITGERALAYAKETSRVVSDLLGDLT